MPRPSHPSWFTKLLINALMHLHPIASSLVGPNVLLGTLFWNSGLRSSFRARDKLQHPEKSAGTCNVLLYVMDFNRSFLPPQFSWRWIRRNKARSICIGNKWTLRLYRNGSRKEHIWKMWLFLLCRYIPFHFRYRITVNVKLSHYTLWRYMGGEEV